MSDTQSVLDTMTAGIIGRKAERAATLTPVGMERAVPHAAEQGITLEQAERLLQDLDDANRAGRRAYENLIRTGQRFVAILSGKPDTALDEAAVVGDFPAEFAAKAAAAQAATFGDAPPLDEGWSCSVHDQASLKELTSRKGRKYRACTLCEEFEK